MGLALRDEHRYTYRDYRGWTGDERWELIDGLAYAMAPAPTRSHQVVVGEIFFQIRSQLDGHACRPFVAPFDVRLPRSAQADDETDTVVQPDVAVICDPAKLDERGCRGAPDWVIEVLSPATAEHDHVLKRALYERSGVAEYWLVHPTDRTVLVYRLRDGEYGKPDAYGFDATVTSSAAGSIAVDFARVTAALD